MPKIANPKIIEILQNPYFDHHAVMHLARERLILPNGRREKLFLPGPPCDECDTMIEAGKPGSGAEFLQMHHEMLRVFRFLLEKNDIPLRAYWKDGEWYDPGPGSAGYAPQLWNLDRFDLLPYEITGMFSSTDPDYLRDTFAGVQRRTGRIRRSLSRAGSSIIWSMIWAALWNAESIDASIPARNRRAPDSTTRSTSTWRRARAKPLRARR